MITACTGGHEFSGYKDLSPRGWAYGEQCDFTVTTGGDTVSGNLVLSLTHDNSYPYSNLWIEMTLVAPDGSTISVDTVNIAMCDDSGKWYGKGMPGHYQLSDTVTKRPVDLPDSARVSLRHVMRVDTLGGISQIGVELVR